MVSRVYVEKKPGFDVEASQLLHELQQTLGLSAITGLRILNRYDVEGADRELFDACVPTVFSEPQTDWAGFELVTDADDTVFAVEPLPGQFDQRADSASMCMQLVSQGARPAVSTAKVYVLSGDLSAQDVEAVKHHVINPVESREASLEPVKTLAVDYPEPADVEVLSGFTQLDEAALRRFIDERGLAMDSGGHPVLPALLRRGGARPFHHRDQDDRHLLV